VTTSITGLARAASTPILKVSVMEEVIQWLLKEFPHAVVLSAFPVCFKVFGWVEDQLSASAKHEVTEWLRSVAKYAAGAKHFDLLDFHNKLFGERYFDSKSLRRTLLFSFIAYLFVLLPSMYFSVSQYYGKLTANCVDLILMLIIFVFIVFPLDLCGVALTRKLSVIAGHTFTIKRSIIIFSSDLIGKTVVFPIVGMIFCLFVVVAFFAITGNLWHILPDLMPHWLEDKFQRNPTSLLDTLTSLELDEAFEEAIDTQQLDNNAASSNFILSFYFVILPSIAICSAWVWLYAISLHVVRLSVFLFDVDTKPIRSAGIVAGFFLTCLLAIYQPLVGFQQQDLKNDDCTSLYYEFLIFRRSEKSLSEAISFCPKNAIAYYLRGAHYSSEGDGDRAIADFSESILLDTHPFFALIHRADEYLTKKNYDQAINDYSKAIEQCTPLQEMTKESIFFKSIHKRLENIPQYLFHRRAGALASKGMYERAVSDYSEAIKLIQDKGSVPDSSYYREIGNAYMWLADYDKAIVNYSEVIQLLSSKDDNLTADALSLRGNAYSAKGQYDLAISDFGLAIELGPDKQYFYLRGRAYAANGSYKKSIEDYDRAIQLDSTYRNALYSRGVSRDQQGDYSLAIADFRRAIGADPADAYSALWLFLVRAKSEPAAAADELSVNSARLTQTEWPYPIVEAMLGLRTTDSTLAAASSPAESCEGHFFLGERGLLEGDGTIARRFLSSAENLCPKQSTTYFVAKQEIQRLGP
jgi:tetratricopeptide (TPR) repeat protein